ncbi:hypothetical protein [Rhodohalobacter barkolensis]|uniref:Uncharacterized protein n=1 Tax=Rhodohalobacter barkolensis TaxID=2053187 RepID=A0A2N0VFT5_9BACT|nr:hypothetical protein [Rhodohalobacter barkolensis]PKD43008.1 hypothetical protein CWD77_10245 [Rhodohalobacter barkolensis]
MKRYLIAIYLLKQTIGIQMRQLPNGLTSSIQTAEMYPDAAGIFIKSRFQDKSFNPKAYKD